MGGCGEIRHRDNNRLARKELHLNSKSLSLETKKNRYMKKNKKQLHEALAVLLTKLSSAMDNPLLMKSISGDASVKEALPMKPSKGW